MVTDEARAVGTDARGAQFPFLTHGKKFWTPLKNTGMPSPFSSTPSPSLFSISPCRERHCQTVHRHSSLDGIVFSSLSCLSLFLYLSPSSSSPSPLLYSSPGSVARDCMANERTFLAWLRTSLNCITLGVAIIKLLDSSTLVKVTGLFFIVQGICAVLYPLLSLLLFSPLFTLPLHLERYRERGEKQNPMTTPDHPHLYPSFLLPPLPFSSPLLLSPSPFFFFSSLPLLDSSFRYGMVRYRAITFHVEHGQYPVDATGPMIFMAAAVCGGVLALAIAIGVVVN